MDNFVMNYRLLKPGGYSESYSPGYPIIIVFHGGGEAAACVVCGFQGEREGELVMFAADEDRALDGGAGADPRAAPDRHLSAPHRLRCTDDDQIWSFRDHRTLPGRPHGVMADDDGLEVLAQTDFPDQRFPLHLVESSPGVVLALSAEEVAALQASAAKLLADPATLEDETVITEPGGRGIEIPFGRI